MLKQTPVFRNLDYQWRIFGRIDLFDAIVCGSVGISTEVVCFMLGKNMSWGLVTAAASIASCIILRHNLSSNDFLAMLRFSMRSHSYSPFKPDTEVDPL